MIDYKDDLRSLYDEEEGDDDDLFSLYQRTTTTTTDEMQNMHSYTPSSPISTSFTLQDDEDDILMIPQNLTLEQHNYQFPIIHYSDDEEEIGKDPFNVAQTHHKDMSSDPSASFRTITSHKLLIKLDKNRQCTVIYNEGDIDDTDCELESECTFYPVKDDKETLAAIKIQSLWRGYQTRKTRTDNDTVVQLILLCGQFHQEKLQQFQTKLDYLEKRVQEEKAMRVAFETAMENLTEIMDQQQKMLYDRLNQQVRMRRSCESKMKDLLKSLHPLELKLQRETEARKKLEVTMHCVLEELKKNNNTREQTSLKHASRKSIIPERPSVIPSRRFTSQASLARRTLKS